METIAANQIPNEAVKILSPEFIEDPSALIVAMYDEAELRFELGAWLSGIRSFLRNADRLFTLKESARASRKGSREIRLIRAALLRCSKINLRLMREPASFTENSAGKKSLFAAEADVLREQMAEFAGVLRDAVILCENLAAGTGFVNRDLDAFRSIIAGRIESLPIAAKFESDAAAAGAEFLPDNLRGLSIDALTFAENYDIWQVLPRFGMILKWLAVVGGMLGRNEPLKPSLLIFAHVYEQIRDLIEYLNNRLALTPNANTELFNTLDAAAYTASIELRRVLDHELLGMSDLHSAMTIHSRVETAYSLLNDTFQQILVGIARLSKPETAAADIFPEFQIKLEQSMLLRHDLWEIIGIVKSVEAAPENAALADLRRRLEGFLNQSHTFLFFKDKETVERFCEEVAVINDRKDIVPILHRFGAYLETLFGQVKLRMVLAEHPFDPDQKQN